jgi:hypothetical protein
MIKSDKPISIIAKGEFNFEAIRQAWKYSRPNETNPSVERIIGVDVPVNEFSSVVFEIFAPIYIREWLVTYRDHRIWARTSRVDDLSSWNVPFMFKDENEACKRLYDQMESEKSSAHQDEFRLNLPLAYMTHFSAVLNFRQAVKLMKSALECSKVAYKAGSHSVASQFREFSIKLFDSISKYPSLVTKALQSYSVEPIDIGSLDIKFGAIKHGPLIIINVPDCSLALRAQAARHRNCILKDDFFYRLIQPLGCVRSLKDTVNLSLAMTQEQAIALARKRNCWIAQEDIWSPIISLINKFSDSAFKLPCDKGPCTADRDNRLRIEGRDPAPPCPRYARINNEPLTEEQRKKATDYLKLKPTTAKEWSNEI